MTRDGLGEEQVESRWEAAPAVVLVILLQVALGLVSRAKDWSIWDLPWWVWLLAVGPETLLVVLLAWSRPRRRLEQLGLRRTVSVGLLGLISLTNALLLAHLVRAAHGQEEAAGGGQASTTVPSHAPRRSAAKVPATVADTAAATATPTRGAR